MDARRTVDYSGTAMPVLNPHPPTPKAARRTSAAIDARLDLRLFQALSDPTRLLVLSCLVKCGRRCSASEVAECCAVDFSVVNKHLKLLAGAGVLSAEKEGRTVWYAARCGELCRRFSLLVDAITEWCPNMPMPGAHSPGRACCDGPKGGTR